jgi:hypothetical protein
MKARVSLDCSLAARSLFYARKNPEEGHDSPLALSAQVAIEIYKKRPEIGRQVLRSIHFSYPITWKWRLSIGEFCRSSIAEGVLAL